MFIRANILLHIKKSQNGYKKKINKNVLHKYLTFI